MEKNHVSRTALSTAYMRFYHAQNDEPKIFDDFLAYNMLPEEIRTLLEQHLARNIQLIDPARAASCPDIETSMVWSMQAMATPPIVLSRARYTEDCLEEACRQGVKQYVILGAGMDTFAFRHPELIRQLQVFEVDHPATQTFKCNRLTELGWEQPEHLHFIPVDFTQESLSTALTRSSYDPKIPSFFSWLGVTMYLTIESVFATLSSIVDIAPAGSTVIFDYLDTDAYIPDKAAKRVQVMIENVRQLGEPMIAGFDPAVIATDLAHIGLRLQEDLSPSDIQERYFQGRKDGYYACEHVHIARAVVE